MNRYVVVSEGKHLIWDETEDYCEVKIYVSVES